MYILFWYEKDTWGFHFENRWLPLKRTYIKKHWIGSSGGMNWTYRMVPHHTRHICWSTKALAAVLKVK